MTNGVVSVDLTMAKYLDFSSNGNPLPYGTRQFTISMTPTLHRLLASDKGSIIVGRNPAQI